MCTLSSDTALFRNALAINNFGGFVISKFIF
jgi:hypothetical protein